jgi:capsular polysaccharide biosynthesis protein
MLKRVVSPSAARWLREEVLNQLSNIESENHNRLLISRDDVGYRKMKLNDRIIDRLISLDFCEIELTNLPFEKQMRMFVNAEIILGPHGAGFVNSIFSEHALLFEVNGDILKPSYYFMSQCVGNKYYSVRGQSQKTSNPKKFDQDIVMSDDFITVVESILKSCGHYS